MAGLALLSGQTVSPSLQHDEPSSTQVAVLQESASPTSPVPPPSDTLIAIPQPEVPQAPSVAPAEPPTAPATAPAPENDAGTIVVTGRSGPPPGDPAEAINEVSFVAVQAVDTAIVAPITHGYDKAAPGPAKRGVYNVLNNLNEPVVFLNYLLQLKIGKAAATAGRFTINSTIGVGGLMDVAKKKPFNLPRRANGFGDTLGYYGIGPGPYLYLPLIGSTNVRDLLGRVVDLSVLPVGVGKPFSEPLVSFGKGTVSALDDRLRYDDILERVKQSDQPYAAMREYYLKKRQAQIDVLKGKRCSALLGLDELDLLYKGDLPKSGKSDGIRVILPTQKPSCTPNMTPFAP
jgi:phospholipid-binding lipoprotein MlaA